MTTIDKSQNSVIDDASLAELMELDRASQSGIFERIVRIYLDRAPVLLRDLQLGVDADDADAIFAAAHELKSSSANVGATTLSALCKDLEMLGRSGSTMGATAQLAEITQLYHAVVAELSRRIQTNGA